VENQGPAVHVDGARGEKLLLSPSVDGTRRLEEGR
jgi:hypothetical protein